MKKIRSKNGRIEFRFSTKFSTPIIISVTIVLLKDDSNFLVIKYL